MGLRLCGAGGLIMEDIIQVQIRFSVDTKHGTFNDALYIPYDDYQKIAQEDIDALKQERVDNYVAQVENPPVKSEPTKQDLESEKASLEQYSIMIAAQVADLTQKIAAK